MHRPAKTQTQNFLFNLDEGSPVSVLEMKIETPEHGSGTSQFIVRCGSIPTSDFWEKMHRVNDALNATPDDYPKNLDEMSHHEQAHYSAEHNREGNHFGYPSYRGSHV